MAIKLVRFKPALISKGLRLSSSRASSRRSSLQASPDFKGIKTPLPAPSRCASGGFKPALISKGLRLGALDGFRRPQSFKPALISKGLRPLDGGHVGDGDGLQASPDFKGIKTMRRPRSPGNERLQASPDFKGIKTRFNKPQGSWIRFKPALISKGLRQRQRNMCMQ